MYVTSKELLINAAKGQYAVGAFNVENAEMVWAVIAAAEELKAPVIIQTTTGTLGYLDSDYFAGMVSRAADKAKVPVALHLDHGASLDIVKKCIASGYSSVMIDGSALSYEENAAITRDACVWAAGKDIPVEGELGIVGGKEDNVIAESAKYTDPDQAADFAKRTGVTSLAISIGTAHGFYEVKPELRLDIITKTKDKVEVPLVLHGASGLPDETVTQAIRLGMSKVNFATELRAAYTDAVRDYLEQNPKAYDPKKLGGAGREAVKRLVMHKIAVCESQGRA